MLTGKELEIVEKLKDFTMSQECGASKCEKCLFKVPNGCEAFNILARFDDLMKIK